MRRSGGCASILMQQDDRILRLEEVTRTVGLSKSTILRRIRHGQFPRPVRLGGPDTQAVGWRHSEVMKWVAKREKTPRD